jgi:hypothetical protein
MQTRILNKPGMGQFTESVPQYNDAATTLSEKYTPEQLSTLNRSAIPGLINDIAPLIEDRRHFNSVDGVPGGGWYDPVSGGSYRTKQGALRGLTDELIGKEIDQTHDMQKQQSVNQNNLDVQSLRNQGEANRQGMAGSSTAIKKEQYFYKHYKDAEEFVEDSIESAKFDGSIDSKNPKAIEQLRQSLRNDWEINVTNRARAAASGYRPVTLPNGTRAYTDGKAVYNQSLTRIGMAK